MSTTHSEGTYNPSDGCVGNGSFEYGITEWSIFYGFKNAFQSLNQKSKSIQSLNQKSKSFQSNAFITRYLNLSKAKNCHIIVATDLCASFEIVPNCNYLSLHLNSKFNDQ